MTEYRIVTSNKRFFCPQEDVERGSLERGEPEMESSWESEVQQHGERLKKAKLIRGTTVLRATGESTTGLLTEVNTLFPALLLQCFCNHNC